MDKEAEELDTAVRRVDEATAEVRACVNAGRSVPPELTRRLTVAVQELRTKLSTPTRDTRRAD